MTLRNVKQLRSGQKFRWADRTVTVICTGELGPRRAKRPARQIMVSIPDIGEQALWYYEDEKVEMVDGSSES
jgi:hypothetical protein